MRVVVVDSGIDGAHPGLRHGPAIAAFAIENSGRVVASERARDPFGHGTAMALAIRALATDVDLVAIRVFEHEPRCDLLVLAAALEHASTLSPTVVNVSLARAASPQDPGESSAITRLAAAAAAVRAAGARLVVAAVDAVGRPSVLAQFDDIDVVAVDANAPTPPTCRALHGRRYWLADPTPPRSVRLPSGAHGTSLATANVSGYLAALAAGGAGMSSPSR